MDIRNFDNNCPIGVVFKIMGGKWKALIVYILLEEKVKRFNELQRLIPNITQRMLTNQLRELEKDKIITRKVYAQVPPKVEYTLSDIGKSLTSIMQHLENWGNCYLDKNPAK